MKHAEAQEAERLATCGQPMALELAEYQCIISG